MPLKLKQAKCTVAQVVISLVLFATTGNAEINGLSDNELLNALREPAGASSGALRPSSSVTSTSLQAKLDNFIDRILSSVLSANVSEAICLACLLRVIMTCEHIGDRQVRQEIASALGSQDVSSVRDGLIAVLRQTASLESFFRVYYDQHSRLQCEQLPLDESSSAACQLQQVFLDTHGERMHFNSSSALIHINRQVELFTRGHITDFFSYLSPDTSLAIVSSMFFSSKFPTRMDSSPGYFYVPHGAAASVLNVTMLHEIVDVSFMDSAGDGVIGVAKNYRSGSIKLFLFKAQDRTADITSLIRSEHFTRLNRAPQQRVVLSFPQFEVSSSMVDYRGTLQRMGVRRMFQRGLGYLGASRLDQFVQKAKIKVDRDGTLAVGVAGGSIESMIRPQTSVTFDGPFVAAIYDSVNQFPIFIAYVVNPNAN